jgi:lipoate-protein ligase A
METWRVIDTGLRRAAENIALNRALLEARRADAAPRTLRFLRFRPSALIGFHQSVAQELDADYCAAHGIEIQRRITGGGAIYFDESQLGWELYLDKQALGTADMLEIARRVCETAAAGIRRLGVDARFRPRNDIEVGGRKISGTGGAFDGDAILYQGTLLIDFDVERMLRVLRIPAEKLTGKAIASARERVVNLRELLGAPPDLVAIERALTEAFAAGFGVEFEEAGLTPFEEQCYRQALAEIDTPEWVYQINRPAAEAPVVEGLHKCEGGLLRAAVHVDLGRGRIKQVWLTGDFFVDPRRMVADLEAALKDTPIEALRRNVHAFFDRYRVEMLLLRREDFIAAIEQALAALPQAAAAGRASGGGLGASDA